VSNRRLGSVGAAWGVVGATLGGDAALCVGAIGTLGGAAPFTLGGGDSEVLGSLGDVVTDWKMVASCRNALRWRGDSRCSGEVG
jgi:hypothetical protein